MFCSLYLAQMVSLVPLRRLTKNILPRPTQDEVNPDLFVQEKTCHTFQNRHFFTLLWWTVCCWRHKVEVEGGHTPKGMAPNFKANSDALWSFTKIPFMKKCGDSPEGSLACHMCSTPYWNELQGFHGGGFLALSKMTDFNGRNTDIFHFPT